MKNDLALLALRLSGLLLAFGHGWGKVSALMAGETGFVERVASLGFPLPYVFAWAAALSEFAGGLLVALGLATRVSAALAGFTVFVASFFRHKAHLHLLVWSGLMSAEEETVRSWGNPEGALLFLLVMIGVALMGPGKLALDRFVRFKL